jgi:hypothetical protein
MTNINDLGVAGLGCGTPWGVALSGCNHLVQPTCTQRHEWPWHRSSMAWPVPTWPILELKSKVWIYYECTL